MMARDDFSKPTVDRMAKRVGMKCSYPDCHAPTSGPDAAGGITNTGIAAHISAASPGGARYDPNLSSEERSDIGNGIWLCQNHAKLIDDDELSYPTSSLREWKKTAEHMAALEARGFSVQRAAPFPDLEKKAPALIAEMKADLRGKHLVRQFILLHKGVTYIPGTTPYFVYYYEDHEFLPSIITIMEHVGAIYDIAYNGVPRYNFTEPFASFLVGDI
jgi:hypothetical protein